MKVNAEFKSLVPYNPVLDINSWIKKYILWYQGKSLTNTIYSFIENIQLLLMELSVAKLLGELTEHAELLINGWHGISSFFH